MSEGVYPFEIAPPCQEVVDVLCFLQDFSLAAQRNHEDPSRVELSADQMAALRREYGWVTFKIYGMAVVEASQ